MGVRYVLTRRWLGILAVLVAVLLVASIAAPALIGADRSIPSTTIAPVVVALLATAIACVVGIAAAGLDRTPYW